MLVSSKDQQGVIIQPTLPELRSVNLVDGSWVSDCNWFKVEVRGKNYVITATDIYDPRGKTIFFTVSSDCINGKCTCVHKIAGNATQLQPCRFFAEIFLRGDLDPDWEFLMRGVIFTFKVINENCEVFYDTPNYTCAVSEENYATMNNKFKIELEKGAVSISEVKPDCIHGVFCIPKDEGAGVRSIVDCSKPAGYSVNDHTDEVLVHFSYNSIDDVVENMSVNDYISTVDVADAYRAVSIHPTDRRKQGLRWNFGQGDKYLCDNRLCMGLSSSPYIFSKVSDFIVRCTVREGCNYVLNYLDDFAIVNSTCQEGRRDQMRLISVLSRLGFSISYKKVTPPATVV